jgi:hypothetical protein
MDKLRSAPQQFVERTQEDADNLYLIAKKLELVRDI